MNKIYSTLFMLCLASSAFATSFCPNPEDIFPYNYMGFTVYRATDYLSRGVYEPDLKVEQFIQVEANEDFVTDCWYIASRENDPKPHVLTLSPLNYIKPNLDHPSWHKQDSNYYICDGGTPGECPLD